MNRVQLVVFLSFAYNPSSEGIWPVCLPCLSHIRVTNMIQIPHQIQKSFSPVSLIHSSQTDSFTCENFETEFRLLLRVFREQLVWLFVKFLFYSKPRSHFARNFASLASLVRRNWRWLRKQRWMCTLVHTYTYTLYSTLEWAPNLGSPVNTIATCSHLKWSSEHCSDLKKYK